MGDRDNLALVFKLVIQAVLTGNKRGPVDKRHIVAGLGSSHQGAEYLGFADVTPAEVVEQGYPREVTADGNNLPQGFINCRGGHPVGVYLSVSRVYAAGHDGPHLRAQHRSDDGGITRAVVFLTHQGLKDAAPLYLMVVLADDPLLTAHVPRAEDAEQGLPRVFGAGKVWFGVPGWCPDRFTPHLGDTVVQKLHIEVSHLVSLIEEPEVLIITKLADNHRLDIFAAKETE